MTAGSPSFLPVILGGVLAFVFLLLAFLNLRRKRLIDDLPTSKVQGVFLGQTELKGTAESEAPFVSYLAERRCVLYRWTVEEHWSRTYIVMTKNGPQTRTESGWKEVAQGGQSASFYLKDDTGIILIDPAGASITPASVFDETVGRKDALYFGKGPAGEVANSTHRRRFHESALPLHAQLYVTGYAREREDVVAPEIARDKRCPLYLISVRTEKQISRGFSAGFWAFFVLGLLFALGGVALENVVGLVPGAQLYLLAGGVYLAVFAAGWLWTVYNSLVGLHNRVRQGASQIDVQLKRRHDLIPNLVEAVKGYASHERGVQEMVTELRSQLEGGHLHGLAPALVAVRERYPDLKANENFLSLQRELSATEQRLALARGYYNDIVTFYNTRLDIIPDRFVAVLAGLRHESLLAAADFERAPVRVQLAE